MADKERPLGVTIIGILWILGGLIYLFGGLGAAAIGGILLGALGAALGAILIIIGIIFIILGIGCFMAWPWVWTVGVILTIIGLILSIASLFSAGAAALIGIIIDAIILWYLFQPQVKAYFGKA
jgi:hypothetical protein